MLKKLAIVLAQQLLQYDTEHRKNILLAVETSATDKHVLTALFMV